MLVDRRADLLPHELPHRPPRRAAGEEGGAKMIEIDNVHKSFGTLEVVKGVT